MFKIEFKSYKWYIYFDNMEDKKMTKRPVILVVMDGVGINESNLGNAVALANKPTLDYLWENCPNTSIRAHGLAVGLPSDGDMGNSEVGHNAIGCGQIYSQGAKLVNENIESKEIFNSKTWKELAENAKDHKMHFIGLLSDGNVHSHINHLKALIEQAKVEGIKEVRVHALLDGRDVPETSALTYIDDIENFMAGLMMIISMHALPAVEDVCRSPWTVMKQTGLW